MKYKRIKNIFGIIFFLVLTTSFAQIQTNQQAQSQINTNENVFLDASNFNLNTNSEGKGLLFPQTDLTQWVFNLQSLDGITFPSAFDGMIVYNIGTGTTLEGQGQVVSVSPGFYYFSNPGTSTAINNGTWVKIGAQGPQGLKGDTGSEGPQGAQGAAGTNGSNGATWTSGSGVPSDTSGTNGDYYLDTTTSDVYLKAANTYSIITNIKGATGTQGAAGTNGINGATWTSGSGVPSDTSGTNGDYYLDTTTSDVYLKTAGTYSILTNIKGATGAQGPQGTQAFEGTTNMLSKFTGTSTLGNSNISDNGTLVTIATDSKINGLSIGRGPGNYDSNTVLGLKALDNITSGLYNTAVGHQALRYNSSGSNNVAVGRDALFNNTTGGANIALGKSALLNNTTGGGNIAFGFDTMLLNTIGIENVAVGQYALRQNITGARNTALGRESLINTTSNLNTAIGYSALSGNTNGTENVAIGNSAGTDSSSGSNMTSTNYSVYIGARTKGLNVTGSTNEIVIGNAAVGLGSNSTVLGNSATTKAAIYGNLLLGTTTDDGFKLNVNGTGRFSGQLSLGSTITNGTNTFTLPSATGTLALASELHSPVTIGTANGLSLSGQALSLSVANSTASGALSTSDWTTFNDKLGGTGTTNYIPKFTASRVLGNSLIFDNGSNVGIGTIAPEVPLHIINNSTSHILRLESNSTDGTTLMLKNNSTGGSFWRLYSSGSGNGEGAGHLLFNNSVGVPVVIRSNGNVLIGTSTDAGAKLNVNGTGRFSGQLSLGSTITNGTNTYTLPSASGTLALTSGTNTTNTLPKFTGTSTLGNSNISDNGTLVSITTDATINGLSVGRGTGNFDSNTVFGIGSLTFNTGNNNSAFGYFSLRNNTSGSLNTAIGRDALYRNTTGNFNLAVGKGALLNNTSGFSNIAIGNDSGLNNTLGSENIAVGLSASNNNQSGYYNIAMGNGSLFANTESSNTAIGWSALNMVQFGSNNIAIGFNAGRYTGSDTTAMTSVSNSIYIGSQSRGLNATGSTNEIVIGNNTVGLGSNSIVLGNSATTKSAIYGNLLLGSTTDNGAKLQVTGAVTVAGAYTNSTSNNEGSDTTIDFSLSNIAYTATTNNAITISNIKDGGTYHLAITDTTMSDKVTFTVPVGFSLRDMGTTNRTSGNMHLYRFIVAGTNVFVTMSTGN